MHEKLQNMGKLPCFMAENLSKMPQIKHFFTTRLGGVSRAEFSSLNTGLPETSLDDPADIEANMNVICKSFGIARSRLFTVKQVHEKDIYVATGGMMNPEPVADAIITQQKGLALGVRTADCVPILLSAGSGDMVAAVHAGWPSTYAGIIQATVKKMVSMGADLNEIVASVGPAIAEGSYEVGKEIFLQFTQQSYEYSAYFRKAERAEHYMFNLSGLAAKILDNAGVRNIEHIQVDTYENEDLLFSHRRATHNEQKKEGRQLSVIMISD
ncbi:MAG: peptidoglycan editing factor PgeF [Alphaproteobacteria bacterium]|nr:peptidoglycan editing factor PgeF [Alphaproteobacteria bacterium]